MPELVARKKGVEITHEAAVGKISEKEITYLMTRKLAREQAVSLIIRGFMDVGILGLPDALNAEIKRIVEISTESESPAKDVAKQKLTRKWLISFIGFR